MSLVFLPISSSSDQSIHSESLDGGVTNTVIEPASHNAGFKIVFDNLDKTIRQRHMTIEKQTQSLHYVQAYAVKDRIDYSIYRDNRENIGEFNLHSLLPDSEDYSSLKERFAILVSRVVIDYIPFFQENFHGLVERHIKHKYSVEMSKKSDVVSYLLPCLLS